MEDEEKLGEENRGKNEVGADLRVLEWGRSSPHSAGAQGGHGLKIEEGLC